MDKCMSLLLIIFSIFFWGCSHGTVYANSNDKPKPIEEFYPEFGGYTTAEEAIKEFEEHFNRDLKLPLRIPPITFTHYLGRFSDLDGAINDSLELMFISEKSPGNHYRIDVRAIEHKIQIPDRYIVKKVNLKNANKAIYMKFSRGPYALVFERDDWQYMLSNDNRISDKVTAEVLVKIANSIDYPSKKKNPF
ncbi:hypothetical protein [Halobacillus trueperi]|uniref:DUF4367 domain-containing protein n=1 Tax=Halobacillus trueperi TaxID=156205 RepID=A0A3E0IYB9_9BACI|nr:hypothetical protein [Halobacillus trueperi]REJ05633.1 hypothetical protein DYE48_20325 [Halobacillus trueperi]